LKILVYSETPTIETGTAQVAKHLLSYMVEFGHEIEVCAINHFSESYDHEKYPYTIHASPPTEAYNLEKAHYLIRHAEYDALFLYADVSQLNALTDVVIEAKKKRTFPVILYTCLDCDLINHQTLRCLTVASHIIMYSNHSRSVALRYMPALAIQTIYHGCEPETFYPLSEEERRATRKHIFGIEDNMFVVISVARNQWRKDPGRTLMIFHEFHKTHPDSMLYMHTKMQDIGGSLPDAASILGMRLVPPMPEIAFAGQGFSEQSGFSRPFLNKLYNCADCFISTSTGEGFGLTTTEAMAAQIPLVVPRNSSFVELIGEQEERGYLALSGGDIDHMVIPYGVSDNPRPIVHAQSMINALHTVYCDPKAAKAKAIAAREWTQRHTWGHIKEQWRVLFEGLGRT
jgi:glycosyltransferase involved in cell wall biosynthesis